MRKPTPQSRDYQEYFKDGIVLSEPLLAQVYNNRVQLTPVLWVRRIKGHMLELMLGKQRRPAWLRAGRSVTIEIVSACGQELVTVSGDILEVARSHEGPLVMVELSDMTLVTSIRLMELVDSAAKTSRATNSRNKRKLRQQRKISGVILRSDLLGKLPPGMPELPKAANE